MADLRLILELITKGESNLKGVSNDLSTIEKQTQSLSGSIKKGLAFGTGFVGALGIKEGIEFLGEAINKAAEFQDTVSATGVIFGQEAIPAMEEFAETADTAFFASKQLALESANQFAVFGKSAGLAGDDLTDFATELTALGGDLASFFGGRTEDAITAIGAALRGESEPIRRYGVLLDDATLRAKAFELGLIANVKNGLSPQMKVLAAHAAILEQTTDAQGDAARTAGSAANIQRNLAAEFENLQEELGEKLLPIFVEVASFLRDEGIPAFHDLIDAFDTIGQGAENLGNSFGAFKNDVGNIGVIIRNLITPWDGVNEAMTTFDDNSKQTLGAVQKHQKEFIEKSSSAWEDYSNTLSNASFDADKLTRTQIDAMEAHWDDIRTAGSDMVAQYNLGIFEAQTDLQTQIDALLKALDEHLAPGEEIAKLRGQKMQLMLARGVQEDLGDDGAVAAIDALIADINAQLTGLAGFGYDAAVNMVTAIAAGLKQRAALNDVRENAYAIGGIIRAGVGIDSEPKDPNSPLRGITHWGENIVTTIADGMRAELSSARSATSLLASALAVSPGVGSALGPDVSVPSEALQSATGQVIINVQGDLRADESTLPGHMLRALYAAD